MGSVQLLRVSMLALTAAMLGACAGGGGGGGGGPIVSPPPPPPPPPPAATLLGPFAAVVFATGIGESGASSSNVRVAVRDPDAPNATTYAELNLDGDETLIFTTPQFSGQTANVPGAQTLRGFGGGDRYTDSYYWDSSQYQLLRLEEGGSGRIDAASSYFQSDPRMVPDPADHVTLLQWASAPQYWVNGTRSGYQLIGTSAALSDLPTTGSALFRGDAYGMFVPTGAPAQRTDFIARASMEIDFSQTTGAIRGGVEYLLPNVQPNDLSQLDFSFVADRTGTNFTSASVSFPFLTGTPSGSLNGQFYGNAGDLEAGATFSFLAPGRGQLVGAFVAGRVADSVAIPSPQSVQYAYIARSAGSDTMGVTGVTSGPNNQVTFTPNAPIDTDDRFDLLASIPNGGGSVVFGSPLFDASTRQHSGAPEMYRIVPEFWASGGGALYRYPLPIVRDGQSQYPIFAQALEYRISLPSGPYPITTFDLYTTIGATTPLGDLPTMGEATFLGEAVGSYQNFADGLLARVNGQVSINANFATRRLAGAIDNFVPYNQDGPGTFDGVGFLGRELSFSAPFGETFTATNAVLHYGINPSASAFNGTVVGRFYGPSSSAAAEIGGSFSLSSPGLANFAGVYVAGSNPTLGINTGLPQTFSTAPGASSFLSSLLPMSGLNFSWTRGGGATADDAIALAFTRDAFVVNVTTPNPPTQGLNRFSHVFDPNGGGAFSRYEQIETSGSGPFNISIIERIAGLNLNYASVGRYFDSSHPDGFFAFGQRTNVMPTTGSAAYDGVAVGQYRTGGNTTFLDGRFTMSANFSTGALSGALDMVETSFPGVNPDFTFAGTISGTQFSSPFTTADGVLTGTIGGIFAGPNAAEVAGTFSTTTSPTGAVFEGGFVGRR